MERRIQDSSSITSAGRRSTLADDDHQSVGNLKSQDGSTGTSYQAAKKDVSVREADFGSSHVTERVSVDSASIGDSETAPTSRSVSTGKGNVS